MVDPLTHGEDLGATNRVTRLGNLERATLPGAPIRTRESVSFSIPIPESSLGVCISILIKLSILYN
jgi:hypothetical protein